MIRLKYIWTSYDKWRKMDGPWLGTWNYKLEFLKPVLIGLAGLSPFIIYIIIHLMNPIEAILHMIHVFLEDNSFDVIITELYIIWVIAIPIGSIPRFLRTIWFHRDLIIIYDKAVYVHDRVHGGLLLREGDVDALVVLSDRVLIFHLTKTRRGIEYLHVFLPEDIPGKALQALLDALKPSSVIRTETSRNILATHTNIVTRFFAKSNLDFVEAFVKKDYAEYFISERDPFRIYYKPLYYLLDSLIGLKLYREALIIALAPYFLDPKEYKRSVNRGLSRVLNTWWKKFMFIDAPWQEIDTLGMIVILVPLCLLAFVIGPIIVFLNVKLPALLVFPPIFLLYGCWYVYLLV